MDDVKGSMVTNPMCHYPNPPQVPSSDHHRKVPDIKLDKVVDLPCRHVNFDSVVNFDEWIRISDSTAIMDDTKGDSFRAQLHSSDTAKLILRREGLRRGRKEERVGSGREECNYVKTDDNSLFIMTKQNCSVAKQGNYLSS